MRNSYSNEREAKQFLCLCRLCYEALLAVTIDCRGRLAPVAGECFAKRFAKTVLQFAGSTRVTGSSTQSSLHFGGNAKRVTPEQCVSRPASTLRQETSVKCRHPECLSTPCRLLLQPMNGGCGVFLCSLHASLTLRMVRFKGSPPWVLVHPGTSSRNGGIRPIWCGDFDSLLS